VQARFALATMYDRAASASASAGKASVPRQKSGDAAEPAGESAPDPAAPPGGTAPPAAPEPPR
jgi:hypothetical protein